MARKKDRYRSTQRKQKGPAAGPSTDPMVPRTTVSIDLRAGAGRSDLRVGDHVRIIGSGLYSGDSAVIERLTGSVVPAAFVRTTSGRTRQVREIDLEPIREAPARRPAAVVEGSSAKVAAPAPQEG